MSGIITLTTDFGADSPYVAAMKGVILSIDPDAKLVDITHSVPPQNVRQGALVLASVTPRFPPDTIHVAVIDPGVGTTRQIVYARIGSQQYVCPDNGLLSRLALRQRPSKIVAATRAEFWLPRVSSTFHGRDIMAPIAARLNRGFEPSQLGSAMDHVAHLAWREISIVPGKIEGAIESIDSFGNLITDISSGQLEGVPFDEVRIACDEHETLGIYRTYNDQPDMTFMALVNSDDHLELAIVGESAAGMLGITVGTPVVLSW